MLRIFQKMPLGRRLSLIALSVSVVMLCAVVFIALGTSIQALRAAAATTLIAENRAVASEIDKRLERIYTVLELIVSSTVDQTQPTGANVEQQVRRFMGQETDFLQRRIVFYAPGQNINFYDFTNPLSGRDILKRTLSSANLSGAEWYQRVLVDGAPGWYGPITATLTSPPEQVAALALIYPAASDARAASAVLWAEVSVRTLDALLRANVTNERFRYEGRQGYSFLVGPSDMVLARMNTDTLRPAELVGIAALARENSVVPLDTPLPAGVHGFVMRSTLPQSGWQLVTVLPDSALPSLQPSTVIQILLTSAFGLLVMIIALNLFVYRTVTVPIQNLSRAAQKIGEGDMAQTVAHQDHHDEVGVMARALEQMRRDLQSSYDLLEQRVRERTVELEIARQAAQSTAHELRAVYDESLSVVTDYQLNTLLDAFAQRILRLLDADYCGVWLLRRNGYELRLVSHTTGNSELDGVTVTVGQGLVGLVAQSARPIMVDNYGEWENRLHLGHDDMLYRALCVPLMSVMNPIGTVMVGRRRELPPFNDDNKRLMMLFANMVSPSVRNAQLIAQLEEARRSADQANLVKTRFLASVTHELRTPLNLIINNLDFMRIGVFGEVTDEQVERLNQTTRSAEHLLYLINDLLDASKIEAGEMKLFFLPTDLYPIIEDALDSALMLLEKEGDGKDTRVMLHADIPADLPQISVDARRVRQVLYNLLSNAVKFTEMGEIRLAVTLSDDYVHFAVSDTGMGISAEDQQHLFRAFERTEDAQQAGIEGTGLGLAISRYLVEAHGGTLTVRSALGEGSTFSFTLPRDEELHPKRMTDTQIIAAVRSA